MDTILTILGNEHGDGWPQMLVHQIVVLPSLWVEVIAPHRGEAFAACQWLIDEMKRVVPIWKKPVLA